MCAPWAVPAGSVMEAVAEPLAGIDEGVGVLVRVVPVALSSLKVTVWPAAYPVIEAFTVAGRLVTVVAEVMLTAGLWMVTAEL